MNKRVNPLTFLTRRLSKTFSRRSSDDFAQSPPLTSIASRRNNNGSNQDDDLTQLGQKPHVRLPGARVSRSVDRSRSATKHRTKKEGNQSRSASVTHDSNAPLAQTDCFDITDVSDFEFDTKIESDGSEIERIPDSPTTPHTTPVTSQEVDEENTVVSTSDEESEEESVIFVKSPFFSCVATKSDNLYNFEYPTVQRSESEEQMASSDDVTTIQHSETESQPSISVDDVSLSEEEEGVEEVVEQKQQQQQQSNQRARVFEEELDPNTQENEVGFQQGDYQEDYGQQKEEFSFQSKQEIDYNEEAENPYKETENDQEKSKNVKLAYRNEYYEPEESQEHQSEQYQEQAHIKEEEGEEEAEEEKEAEEENKHQVDPQEIPCFYEKVVFEIEHDAVQDPFHEAVLAAMKNNNCNDRLSNPPSILVTSPSNHDITQRSPCRPPPPVITEATHPSHSSSSSSTTNTTHPPPIPPPPIIKTPPARPVTTPVSAISTHSPAKKTHKMFGIDVGPLPSDHDPNFPFKSHFEKKHIIPNPKKALRNIISGEKRKKRLARKAEAELELIIRSGDKENNKEELTAQPKGYLSDWQEFQARISATVSDNASKLESYKASEAELEEEKGRRQQLQENLHSSEEEEEESERRAKFDDQIVPVIEENWANFGEAQEEEEPAIVLVDLAEPEKDTQWANFEAVFEPDIKPSESAHDWTASIVSKGSQQKEQYSAANFDSKRPKVEKGNWSADFDPNKSQLEENNWANFPKGEDTLVASDDWANLPIQEQIPDIILEEKDDFEAFFLAPENCDQLNSVENQESFLGFCQVDKTVGHSLLDFEDIQLQQPTSLEDDFLNHSSSSPNYSLSSSAENRTDFQSSYSDLESLNKVESHTPFIAVEHYSNVEDSETNLFHVIHPLLTEQPVSHTLDSEDIDKFKTIFSSEKSNILSQFPSNITEKTLFKTEVQVNNQNQMDFSNTSSIICGVSPTKISVSSSVDCKEPMKNFGIDAEDLDEKVANLLVENVIHEASEKVVKSNKRLDNNDIELTPEQKAIYIQPKQRFMPKRQGTLTENNPFRRASRNEDNELMGDISLTREELAIEDEKTTLATVTLFSQSVHDDDDDDDDAREIYLKRKVDEKQQEACEDELNVPRQLLDLDFDPFQTIYPGSDKEEESSDDENYKIPQIEIKPEIKNINANRNKITEPIPLLPAPPKPMVSTNYSDNGINNFSGEFGMDDIDTTPSGWEKFASNDVTNDVTDIEATNEEVCQAFSVDWGVEPVENIVPVAVVPEPPRAETPDPALDIPFNEIPSSDQVWRIWLRFPEKKKKVKQISKYTTDRTWQEIAVTLTDDRGRCEVNLHELDPDPNNHVTQPFRTLRMEPYMQLSRCKLQQYDKYGKLNIFKINHVTYKELPGIRPEKFSLKTLHNLVAHKPKQNIALDHLPVYSEILKFGSMDQPMMRCLMSAIEDSFMRIPVHKDEGLNYSHEEVCCYVIDEYIGKISETGIILEQKARSRIFCSAFVNNGPHIVLGINDKWRFGREVVRRSDILPVMHDDWITIWNPEFHSCLEMKDYEKDHMLKFYPLDGCKFELMRFRVSLRDNRELPLQVHCTFSIDYKRVSMRCELLVPGYFTASKRSGAVPCDDVEIRIPVPEEWIYHFRVEKHHKYGSVHSTLRKPGRIKRFERITQMAQSILTPSLLEVSIGVAKYEHIFKSIVWRIPRVPEKNEASYRAHLLSCNLLLSAHDTVPEWDTLVKNIHVEFTMPSSTVSGVTVRSISVETSGKAEKFVKYSSKYQYTKEVNYQLGNRKEQPLKGLFDEEKPEEGEQEEEQEEESGEDAESEQEEENNINNNNNNSEIAVDDLLGLSATLPVQSVSSQPSVIIKTSNDLDDLFF